MQILGVNPTKAYTEAEFTLGALAWDRDGKAYRFVKFDGAVVEGASVDLKPGYNCSKTINTSNIGTPVGYARTDVPDNGYGWVQVYGDGDIRVGANAVRYMPLKSTATAGVTDDAGTRSISGVWLSTSRSGTVGLAPAWINFPQITS